MGEGVTKLEASGIFACGPGYPEVSAVVEKTFPFAEFNPASLSELR